MALRYLHTMVRVSDVAASLRFYCDALGLRPHWFGVTEKEFCASSEKGVVPLDYMVQDPRPLAPGETPVAGADSLASPVCYLGTPEAEEYEPYWLAPAR